MLLIKNGHLVDPKSGFNDITDILIDNDRVVKIAGDITPPDNCDIINADNPCNRHRWDYGCVG